MNIVLDIILKSLRRVTAEARLNIHILIFQSLYSGYAGALNGAFSGADLRLYLFLSLSLILSEPFFEPLDNGILTNTTWQAMVGGGGETSTVYIS